MMLAASPPRRGGEAVDAPVARPSTWAAADHPDRRLRPEGGQGIGVGSRDFQIGDVNFLIAPVTGAVPEPATWALMLLGFGGIGLAMRRRQSATPALQPA